MRFSASLDGVMLKDNLKRAEKKAFVVVEWLRDWHNKLFDIWNSSQENYISFLKIEL